MEDFLELCLPAVLAPGNLPVLTEHFAVEVVFVTEERMFDTVRRHPAYARAAGLCRFRLVALDDLVSTRGSYGMSITYAFFRGFEDLGPAMTDCYLVFIHADFILADGSYRGLLPHLLRGERLVYSPSYCTVAEDVRPKLLATKNSDGSRLAVPPRQMAEMILRYRHMSIRAKTVNQGFFSMEYIDQFYWAVDEHTLLVRQFPVALVAMKPERELTELASYWDYGLIADFCPSMRFTSLGDSDDYLMLELRERDNAKGTLQAGWPDSGALAEGLATVMTDYVHEFGRVRFTLHSGELPVDVDNAHRALDAFVGKVLAQLPQPLPSRHNHVQWIHHQPSFQEARENYLAGMRAPELDIVAEHVADIVAEHVADIVAEHVADAAPFPIDRLAHDLQELVQNLDTKVYRTDSATARSVATPIRETVHRLSTLVTHLAAFDCEQSAIDRMLKAGIEPGDGMVAEHIAALGHRRNLFAQAANGLQSELPRILNEELERQTRTVRGLAEAAKPAEFILALHEGGSLLQTLFGSSPNLRRWHWLQPVVGPALIAARNYSSADRVLYVECGLALFKFLGNEGRTIKTVHIDSLGHGADLERDATKGFGYQLCVIEATIAHLGSFRSIFERLRPHFDKNSNVVAVFLSSRDDPLQWSDVAFLDNAFPVCGPAKINFSGSWAAIAAMRLHRRITHALERRIRMPNKLAQAMALFATVPLAMAGTLAESSRKSRNSAVPPRHVASVTIEIHVG